MIIYYFNRLDSVGEEEIVQMLAWMPQQQRDAIGTSKLLARRREMAMSYLMLCNALQHRGNEIHQADRHIEPFSDPLFSLPDVRLPLFRFGEHGKPYLTNHDGIFFNISHCREAIAIGVSAFEIGIDIEGRRRFSETIMQRAFNEEEQAAIQNSDDPTMEFARLWTRKEAFFKWTGTGILLNHIKSVESDAATAGCEISTQRIHPEEGTDFFLSIVEHKKRFVN